MTQAFPLQWPMGWPRTAPGRRSKSQFRTTQDQAQRLVYDEIKRLGGANLVLSTNIPVRKDGLPYASGYRVDDPGVAVYFTHKGEARCFACDRWGSVAENLKAVAKTIEALRGIERWGSSEMVDQAFRGFTALPSPASSNEPHWTTILGLGNNATREDIDRAYKLLAKSEHPDNGGSHEAMSRVNRAREQALGDIS